MSQPGLGGDVRERAVAVVVEQQVLAPAGDEEIVVAVVIVIGHGDAGGPNAPSQSGLLRDIGERAVAVVAVQADDGVRSEWTCSRRPESSTISCQPSLS